MSEATEILNTLTVSVIPQRHRPLTHCFFAVLMAAFVAGGILVPPLAVAAEPPTVLITGASRGMGFEFTQQYAEKGWKVVQMRQGWSGMCFSTLYILLENKGDIK